MKYNIEVREVYGNDTAFKPEMTITKGESYRFNEATRKRKAMQRYSNSMRYKVVKNKRDEL